MLCSPLTNSLAHQQRLEVLENERKLREKEEQEAREKVRKIPISLFISQTKWILR